MTTSRHDRVLDQMEEYALDILEPSQREEVERHLAECPDCAGELRQLELIMERLAHTVEPVNPSPHLRRRVLDALAATPQVESPAVARVRGSSRVIPWMTGALAAAALLAVILGGFLFASMQRERGLTVELSEADDRQRDMQSRLDNFAAQADLAVAILTAGDMRPMQLSAPSGQSASTARAYWSPTQGLLLVADELPAPPPGRIYQVWIIGGSGASPVSAGLLGDDQSRRGMLLVPAPPPVSGTSSVTIAITDEPPGGLPAPTGSMRLVGSL